MKIRLNLYLNQRFLIEQGKKENVKKFYCYGKFKICTYEKQCLKGSFKNK